MRNRKISIGVIFVAAFIATGALAQPASYPAQGQGLPTPLPLFPSNNWWNIDISAAPLDVNSQSYINFIDQPYSSPRKLHPDFGGQVSPGSTDTYGMPFAVVLGTQPRLTVIFDLYPSESDGVGQPFYPIPVEAETQPYWVEGGPAGDVDLRSSGDRHLLVVDRDNDDLYELYNVWFDSANNQWHAGSGAFWDMTTNNTRPIGFTSADAAGLQILPGLVRYDEAYNAYGTNVSEIGHAFRITVRSTNGYVYPASHSAGGTAGALPMGARLRLKASTPIPAGSDAGFTRIFNAMKKYGLIVADNGSDMFITGTYDVNWNNDVLNPLFSALTASDFEVVQLGWQPTAAALIPVSLAVDAALNGTSSDGNGVFEPGETVMVDPTWKNVSLLGDSTLTGVASAFSLGPPQYVISVGSANYGGPILAGATADCISHSCFQFSVDTPASRPTVHWDAQFTETPSDGSAAKVWTLHLGDSFSDVPRSDMFYRYIETIAHHNVTLGCGTGTDGKGLFCESATTTRGQMAAFVARAIVDGDANVPISGSGYNCVAGAGGNSNFADVAPTDSFCRHANYIYIHGITLGCDSVPDFCESSLLSRGQMAAFIARAIAPGGDGGVPVSGSGYDCVSGGSSDFGDVAPTDPFCRHINYLFVNGIVSGYAGQFSPSNPVTRGQSAKFLTNGFSLKLYGP